MRLVGLTIVRNEEDILEASLRHNLRALDAIAVVDHGSDDRTPEIVAGLASEGLAIESAREEAIEYRPSGLATAHMRRLLAAGADRVVLVDADEFLRIPAREAFDREVSKAGAGTPIAIAASIHRIAFDRGAGIAGKLRHAQRRDEPRAPSWRPVVDRAALDRPGTAIADGRDSVVAGGDFVPMHRVDAAVASVAHVPVRSAEQFTAKAAVGYLACLLAGEQESAIRREWAEAYRAILAGTRYDEEALAAIVARYGTDRDGAGPVTTRWVDDPIDVAAALRYTGDEPPRPLARVLAFGERVAAEIARTTGGL